MSCVVFAMSLPSTLLGVIAPPPPLRRSEPPRRIAGGLIVSQCAFACDGALPGREGAGSSAPAI